MRSARLLSKYYRRGKTGDGIVPDAPQCLLKGRELRIVSCLVQIRKSFVRVPTQRNMLRMKNLAFVLYLSLVMRRSVLFVVT